MSLSKGSKQRPGNFNKWSKGWDQLEKTLGDYKAVRDGERPTIYNTPSIVEVMLGYEFE